jgi:predicted transcriptional regulator
MRSVPKLTAKREVLQFGQLKHDKVTPVNTVREIIMANLTAAKTISVKLDADIRTRLENLAEARQRSAHWVMREAINQYVEREEKREAFRQATIKAWDEYQETGLHATPAEVDAWLNSWGSVNELPAPLCHK